MSLIATGFSNQYCSENRLAEELTTWHEKCIELRQKSLCLVSGGYTSIARIEIQSELQTLNAQQETIMNIFLQTTSSMPGLTAGRWQEFMQREVHEVVNCLEAAQSICAMTEKMDEYNLQFESLCSGCIREDVRIQDLEKLKTELHAIATEAKTPKLLKWNVNLCTAIEEEQQRALVRFLQEAIDVIDHIPLGLNSMDTLKQMLLEDLPRCAPKNLLHAIYEEVWVLGGRHQGDLRWGEHHAFEDLSRLSKAIAAVCRNLPYHGPLLKFLELTPLADLPDDPPISPFAKNFDAVMAYMETAECPEPGPLEKLILKVKLALNDPEFDGNPEARKQKINKARIKLPEELRNEIDRLIYEYAEDPLKGGDGWGGKHAAERPDLLLRAATDLKTNPNFY